MSLNNFIYGRELIITWQRRQTWFSVFLTTTTTNCCCCRSHVSLIKRETSQYRHRKQNPPITSASSASRVPAIDPRSVCGCKPGDERGGARGKRRGQASEQPNDRLWPVLIGKSTLSQPVNVQSHRGANTLYTSPGDCLESSCIDIATSYSFIPKVRCRRMPGWSLPIYTPSHSASRIAIRLSFDTPPLGTKSHEP